MSITDEQVWEDLSRFAQAMKRGATVVFNENGVTIQAQKLHVDGHVIKLYGGIREIIEPPQKKIRPLNAEEWKAVAGCVYKGRDGVTKSGRVEYNYNEAVATAYAATRATCHPPGFPNDVRKLWVEQ